MHIENAHIAVMNQDDRPSPAKRLEEARIARGFKTAKAACDYFGWNYVSYSQHESGQRGLSRIADRYAAGYRVGEGWLLTGEGKGPDGEASGGLTMTTAPIGAVAVTGKVAANNWISVDEMDFSYDDIEYVPSVTGYPVSMQFAVKVDGNCLNKKADHGDILVCLNIIKANVEAEPEDLVIVERSRYDGQMIERTAKRIRQTANGYELWPESNDPAHQLPIPLDDTQPGETIQIIGKVLWILRKP